MVVSHVAKKFYYTDFVAKSMLNITIASCAVISSWATACSSTPKPFNDHPSIGGHQSLNKSRPVNICQQHTHRDY